MPTCAVTQLFQRERTGDRRFSSNTKHHRARALQVSVEKSVESVHRGGVTWLDLDGIEHRWLLSAAADASVAAYDIQEGRQETNAGLGERVEGRTEHIAAFKLDRSNAESHKYTITSVCWYPIDTGMFVTGSFDQEIKVWDTNSLVPVCTFGLPDRVFALDMSRVAAVHCLIAVGSAEPQVKLCDLASGAFTHSLVGHRDAIWALHWSLTSEWHLFTSAADGQVRLWDIRTSGCIHVFDQHDTNAASSTRQTWEQPLEGIVGQNRPAQHRQAHEGAVTAVVPTPDGLYCLTAGTDSRIRLWDLSDNSNTLVNFPSPFNRSKKGRQVAVSNDAPLVFHPSGSVIQAFHLHEGSLQKLLRGHIDTVNACCYNPVAQELLTGSNDCQIMVWSPPGDAMDDAHDCWSDDFE
ncbi:hypothetical protein CVIRNUC_002946 [Coccomyxa viridis]|uniref:DNA excision repair protein ERCC-8 n=1 Tax=Coccomyxa viridis TaxID=1274662 RepID=A0AAV1HYU6_9CHLO|nr:hypothetical protein CVIRNUC_002946 [Coccomyxa viridis]